MASPDKTTPRSEGEQKPAAPSISLPKGGGAIRGIGEKFGSNPVTGTGSMTVPIATSPGRSGFGPQLSLSYDSGSGNGPFGFGWSLSLPQITRKTDKGLPQYDDANESDVFILSGAEDLVPAFKKDEKGDWVRDAMGHLVIDESGRDGYTIRQYRPRIEGLFARIERWTSLERGDIHWRSISRDNILTIYGKDGNSRIFDPSDPDPENPKRVFSWLICETRDDRGNAVLYEYKPEDGAGVQLSRAHERNRGGENDSRRKTNRYIKHIRYGNRTPLLDDGGKRPCFLSDEKIQEADWMFEVVFDYGEHDVQAPKPGDRGEWTYRDDPFSSYRGGFEVRVCRLCQRVLMFHHFESEAGVGKDCLVRSTGFAYSHEQDPEDAPNPVYTFLLAVTQSGYRRRDGGYLQRSLPPVEFDYSRPLVQDTVEEVDADSLENLPIGLDGTTYQWTDLHGEGIPGILTEQGGAWFYKRNLSPINAKPGNGVARTEAKFAPVEVVAAQPNFALAGGHAQFMDLAGDGQPDLVVLDGPMPGLYEHDGDEGWQPFRPFPSRLSRDMRDPNLKFVDLDGDGHADVLITEDDAFVWHPSLTEEGFGPAWRVAKALDEEKGPRLVFADGTQSIYLADLSGDGLTDLARIRNGEVCYWPNLGYGRFGAKVTMDHAPWFDNPDQFDHKRIRLADIDGTGTTDIIYLHRDGVRLYFNQSGNGWSTPQELHGFPRVEDLAAITAVDLLGNSTACLVWSSPLPGDAPRPMRYVNLMGEQKPHLLLSVRNNLGAETRVHYAPSTKFYLQDKYDGRPWITRLAFPVHVVERVETYDYISRNRFVTRYAYHHGYFDGEEREFRGFGMVEQWDTEAFAALTGDETLPAATNVDAAFHVPPIRTKTWFHTGVSVGRDHVSDFFAGLLDAEDKGEYYREPSLSDEQAKALLLPDTVLPAGLTPEEEREACRTLKGMMLRQEVYADDAPPGSSDAMIQRARTPYTVVEQDFTIRTLQPRGANRHAVFFTHACEAITYHYERNPTDPRVAHALTLEVDDFGNVLKSAAVGYGRRQADSDLEPWDQGKQNRTLITYTEERVTHPVETPPDYRAPLPCETQTYELTGYTPTGDAGRFQGTDFVQPNPSDVDALKQVHIYDGEIEYEDVPTSGRERRLIEHVRTLYRPDDLGLSQGDRLALFPLGTMGPLALPGETYKLAFTPGLLARVFRRPLDVIQPPGAPPPEDLLPVPGDVLPLDPSGVEPADCRGGYVDLDQNGHWWIPSGRSFYSPGGDDDPAAELAHARSHFFLPHRFRDPFGSETTVGYDCDPVDPSRNHNLLVVETKDALGNVVTVRTKDDEGHTVIRNDYRVLQPYWVTDPNGNRTRVAFDTLGMVVGTAVMGKPDEDSGDVLEETFDPDPPLGDLQAFIANLETGPASLLDKASTRIVYDLDRYRRAGQPPFAATLARETHFRPGGAPTKIQISFSYSDGFGREIQKKIQAEPGLLVEAGPLVNPRWVGSGWTILNNKGKPVRQYEPFFSATPGFEFGLQVGVSPVLFYDPAERVIATLHPNQTYEKVVFDPWQQTAWDVNDTCAARNAQTGDPHTDTDIGGYVAEYFKTKPATWQTWHVQRIGGALGQDELNAALRAQAHADTPTTAHFDALGRPFLTVARNRVVCAGHDLDGTEESFATRVELDIEGNQCAVRDERKLPINYLPVGVLEQRIVMRYAYDMLGNRIHQLSMEAGARWMFNDVAGKPIRAWDSRGHNFTTTYDALRRPVEQTVRGTIANGEAASDPRTLNRDILVDKIEYGDGIANAETLNLRTRIYRHFDSAGVATNARLDANGSPIEAYDFKGNLLRSTRRLVSDYTAIPDWLLNPHIDDETFEGSTRYDAINRPIQSVAPHSSLPRAQHPNKINVIQPVFNEANLLERVDVWLERATEPDALLDPNNEAPSPVGVANIDYDAKGQRLRIDYKNGASTRYRYDPDTFRLIHLYTRRGPAFTEDCEKPQPPPPTIAAPDEPPQGKACGLQNLHYTYDPAGNITHIQDDAQQTIYFRNQRAEPSNDYTYDAIYRLIQATGREHLGQKANGDRNPPTAPDAFNAFHTGLDQPNDRKAMGTYSERYVYDVVGNFLQMQHRGSDPSHPGWTRAYDYLETSLTEDGSGGAPLKTSNRLTRTTLNPNGANPAQVEPYQHDTHGNMVRMPHLGAGLPEPNMHWDYKDQLRRADLGGGGATFYVYDASGQRVRKVWEKLPGLTEERIYLGGFAIFRKHGGPISANTATLERETLHVMDDKQRVALVEMRTLDEAGDDPAPRRLIRCQFANHLGSATLELDDEAQIISYEEYAPYGISTYQGVRSQIEPGKRYRHWAKERDAESGLYYHGARYYACWLGRWVSCDPTPAPSANTYEYCLGNPITWVDESGLQPNCPPLHHKTQPPRLLSDRTLDEAVAKAGALGRALEKQRLANERFSRDLRELRAEFEHASTRSHTSQGETRPHSRAVARMATKHLIHKVYGRRGETPEAWVHITAAPLNIDLGGALLRAPTGNTEMMFARGNAQFSSGGYTLSLTGGMFQGSTSLGPLTLHGEVMTAALERSELSAGPVIKSAREAQANAISGEITLPLIPASAPPASFFPPRVDLTLGLNLGPGGEAKVEAEPGISEDNYRLRFGWGPLTLGASISVPNEGPKARIPSDVEMRRIEARREYFGWSERERTILEKDARSRGWR
jgi:RHS repeat-associated protein